jgi:hypothetical protein
MHNFGIVTPTEWVGLSIDKAYEQANVRGFVGRIVEQDGRAFMVTMDLKPNRINFRVSNGTVTDVYTG